MSMCIWFYLLYTLDGSIEYLVVEYMYTFRVTPTHDLNAILYPPSSENTVGSIAVWASSRLSLHYTGYFNKCMHLYCSY